VNPHADSLHSNRIDKAIDRQQLFAICDKSALKVQRISRNLTIYSICPQCQQQPHQKAMSALVDAARQTIYNAAPNANL
jgi:hypothetical protein